MAVIDLKRVVAVQTPEQDRELGYLFWYTLSECLIEREDLRRLLKQTGLSESYMPPEIRVGDAFRRATSHVELKNVPAGQQEVFYNYLVRDAGYDRYTVVRKIVREKVDGRGKRLAYNPEEAIMTLQKESGDFFWQAPHGGPAEEMCRAAQERYQVFLTHHDDRAVRSMIYTILAGLNPVAVKPSGGVYFVPQNHRDTLNRLVNFIRFMGGRSEGFMIPLIDREDVRDMVREKLRDYLLGVAGELAGLLKADRVKKSKVNLALENAKRAREDFKAYQDLLQEQLSDMHEVIGLIGEQMRALIEHEQGMN